MPRTKKQDKPAKKGGTPRERRGHQLGIVTPDMGDLGPGYRQSSPKKYRGTTSNVGNGRTKDGGKSVCRTHNKPAA